MRAQERERGRKKDEWTKEGGETERQTEMESLGKERQMNCREKRREGEERAGGGGKERDGEQMMARGREVKQIGQEEERKEQ